MVEQDLLETQELARQEEFQKGEIKGDRSILTCQDGAAIIRISTKILATNSKKI